jgi:hypothetical protein
MLLPDEKPEWGGLKVGAIVLEFGKNVRHQWQRQ